MAIAVDQPRQRVSARGAYIEGVEVRIACTLFREIALDARGENRAAFTVSRGSSKTAAQRK